MVDITKAVYAYLIEQDCIHVSESNKIYLWGGVELELNETNSIKFDEPKLTCHGFLASKDEPVRPLMVYGVHECYIDSNKEQKGCIKLDTSIDYPEEAQLYLDLQKVIIKKENITKI